MPIPWLAAAVASQAVSNPLFGHLTNVRNRKFSREMYARQREDALADWAMVNEYNSPRMQMQRYQEAGLNPNLIYGQTFNADPVRSSSAGGASASAPRIEDGIGQYFDIRRTSAQVDLVAQQMEESRARIRKLDADTVATLTGVPGIETNVKRGAVKLALESALAPYQLRQGQLGIERGEAGIDKIRVEIDQLLQQMDLNLQRNERERLANNQSIAESIARIGKMSVEKQNIGASTDRIRQEIENLKVQLKGTDFENQLKEFEIGLREDGIHPGTPGWIRSIQIFTERFRDKFLKK